MMRKLFLLLFLGGSVLANAQIAVNLDGAPPDNSAMLDVKSNSLGALLPRMTQAQIAAIPSPASGLVVFCITDNKFYVYVSGASMWKEILYSTGTIAQFSCGSSFTVNHVAGDVAPVSKTVTYGTVTNIPGETSKCWITSNLGADHQATAEWDQTEASAGWYWQFNRKQGYKYEGLSRTPNTTWISSISESSDWTTANDPCIIELGNGWRIPTYTEWDNVYIAGQFGNYDEVWTSELKLHCAGFLFPTVGVMNARGNLGYYWSSTQTDAGSGRSIWFSYGGICYLGSSMKSSGEPVRCIRDE